MVCNFIKGINKQLTFDLCFIQTPEYKAKNNNFQNISSLVISKDMNLEHEQELQRSLTYVEYIQPSKKLVQQWPTEVVLAKTGDKRYYT